jgi:hypothetical protein
MPSQGRRSARARKAELPSTVSCCPRCGRRPVVIEYLGLDDRAPHVSVWCNQHAPELGGGGMRFFRAGRGSTLDEAVRAWESIAGESGRQLAFRLATG